MLNTPKPLSKILLVLQNKSKIFTKFLHSVKQFGRVRERPFNLKGGGGYGFFLKKIF